MISLCKDHIGVNRRMTAQFQLRLPESLRDNIKEAAEENDRSMNAEIVERLQESFEPSMMSRLADQAFTRGVQIGQVEFLLGMKDPLAALHELRETLRRPLEIEEEY